MSTARGLRELARACERESVARERERRSRKRARALARVSVACPVFRATFWLTVYGRPARCTTRGGVVGGGVAPANGSALAPGSPCALSQSAVSIALARALSVCGCGSPSARGQDVLHDGQRRSSACVERMNSLRQVSCIVNPMQPMQKCSPPRAPERGSWHITQHSPSTSCRTVRSEASGVSSAVAAGAGAGVVAAPPPSPSPDIFEACESPHPLSRRQRAVIVSSGRWS